MNNYNLPPGVTGRDLPGCSREDDAWEWFLANRAERIPDEQIEAEFKAWRDADEDDWFDLNGDCD